MSDPTNVPSGLGGGGTRLWEALMVMVELEEWEITMLHEACRVRDRLDALDAAQAGLPLTVTNHKGDEVASPYLVEARMQAAIFTRLIASLRIPSAEDGSLPQRRGAARGWYGPRPVRTAS